MPKVSVIIPVYGVEKYIERCARSLFEQTLDDIEYLFIDDCTPDRSIEILRLVLEEYPQRLHQVIIHRMEHNSGQAAVRKWGIQNASGDYLIHCDSDDWMDKDMLRQLYEKGIKDNDDIVVCDYYESDSSINKEVKQGFCDKKPDIMFSYYTLWCKIVKRSLFTENTILAPTGNMGEDRVYSVQLAWYAKSIGYVATPLYYYFTNLNSIVHTVDKNKSISIFKQRKANTDLLVYFINSNQIGNCKPYISGLKLQTLAWLYPFLKEKGIYLDWKNSYPELLFDCIRAKGVSFKEKMRYYAAYFRLYIIK